MGQPVALYPLDGQVTPRASQSSTPPPADASARLVHVLLDGFRAGAATDGPVAPSTRRTQLAMRRNAERRLGTKRTRTATPHPKEKPR